MSRKQNAKQQPSGNIRRDYTVRQVAGVILAALVISLVLNTTALVRWAERLDIGWPRDFFLFAIKPLHDFCDNHSLTSPFRELKSRFRTLAGLQTDIGWLDPEDVRTTPLPTTEPLFTAPPPQMEIYSIQNPLEVLIIGDSMVADSIAPVFRKTVQDNQAIVSDNKAQYSSGLSRPDFFNWPAQANELLQQKEYDLVIVMLGMNDAQDIVVDETVYHYGTESWFGFYRSRVKNFVNQLLSRTHRLYWLGMPTMQLKYYSQRMASLNEIYSDVCKSIYGATFISTRAVLDEEPDKYTHSLTMENKIIRVRISDGKHFTAAGGQMVVDQVMNLLKRDFVFREYPQSYIYYNWY